MNSRSFPFAALLLFIFGLAACKTAQRPASDLQSGHVGSSEFEDANDEELRERLDEFLKSPGASNWEAMEIESKWVIKKKTYEKLVEDFDKKQYDPPRAGKYDLEIRWKGIPKKFIDVYFDSPQGDLAAKGHVLRIRTVLKLKDDDDFKSLDKVEKIKKSKWQEKWARLQYKSTPALFGPVWFRMERGDCLLYTDDPSEEVCFDTPDRKGLVKKLLDYDFAVETPQHRKALWQHDGMRLLQRDHPDVNINSLVPILIVEDYRYRVVLTKTRGKKTQYELSLDKLESDRLDDDGNKIPGTTDSYIEAELEILKKGGASFSQGDLENLAIMSQILQDDYKMKPATASKGGAQVN